MARGDTAGRDPERLRRFDEDPETALAALTPRLRAIDDAPAPDRAFVARLEEDLMGRPAVSGPIRSPEVTGNAAPNGRWRAPLGAAGRRARRRVWVGALEAVAVAALVVTIVAGVIAGRGLLPDEKGEHGGLPVIANATPIARLADDTAMFLGNAARTGEVPGPGPATEPRLRWRASIAAGQDGWFRSAPLVVDGIAYLTGDISDPNHEGSGEGHVVALGTATGAERWRVAASLLLTENISPLAVADGSVFVGTTVYEEIEPTAADRTGEAGSLPHAVALNPVPVGGALVALDALTGAERWRMRTGGSGGSAPAVVDGVVYVGSEDGSLAAFDAATGAERWRTSLTTFDPATGGGALRSPAVAAGTVYVTEPDGVLYALDAATGTERWRFQVVGGLYVPPVVAGGAVYAVAIDEPAQENDIIAQRLYALDAATGGVRWTREAESHGWIGQPAVGGGLVYLTLWPDQSRLVALDAETGLERWSFTVAGSTTETPVVAGGVLYFIGYDDGLLDLGSVTDALGLGDATHLYAVDAASGQRLWQIESEIDYAHSATVAEGTLYVIDGRGALSAFADRR